MSNIEQSYALIMNATISQMHVYMNASLLNGEENHISRHDDNDTVYIHVNQSVIKINKDKIEKSSSCKDFIWVAFFLSGNRIIKTDIIEMGRLIA